MIQNNPHGTDFLLMRVIIQKYLLTSGTVSNSNSSIAKE
jgi:hypothetical protein